MYMCVDENLVIRSTTGSNQKPQKRMREEQRHLLSRKHLFIPSPESQTTGNPPVISDKPWPTTPSSMTSATATWRR